MTHNGERIARDITDGNPELALDPDAEPTLEELIASGGAVGEARDVADEAERIATLMANGKLTAQDIMESYPGIARHVNGIDPEFYGDDWDQYDPLDGEDGAYFEDVQVAGAVPEEVETVEEDGYKHRVSH